jgi:hypothetical protein
MPNNYSDLSIEELRTLLLSGELVHEDMQEEDYVIIMDYELEKQEPDNQVIRLCVSALKRYEKYKDLDKINIDINGLIKQANKKTQISKHRKVKKVVLIAAAVIATTLIAQITAAAMGYNLFEYIFNWKKETLEINPDEVQDELYDEPIDEIYEKIEDMPKDIVAFLPLGAFKDFEFRFASTIFYGDNQYVATIVFEYNDSPDIFLMLDVSKGVGHLMEKDDEVFEEYEVGGVRYTIYKNMDVYKVAWVSDGVLYDMGVGLPVEDVKAIINSM